MKKLENKGVSTIAGSVLFIILIFALQTTLFLTVYRYNNSIQESIKTETDRIQEKIVLASLRTDLLTEKYIEALQINNTGSITVHIRAIYIDSQFLCDPSNNTINPTDTYVNAKEVSWIMMPPGVPYNPTSQITAATERGTKSTDYEWRLKKAWGEKPPYTYPKFYLGPLMLDFTKFNYTEVDPRTGAQTSEWRAGWYVEAQTGAIAWNITVKNIDDRDITINQFCVFTLWDNAGGERRPWYIDPPPNSLSQRIKPDETVSLVYKWATPKTNSTKLPNTQSIYSNPARCRIILTFFGIFHEKDGTTKPYGQTIPFEAVLVERVTLTVSASPIVIVIQSTMTSTITATLSTGGNPRAGETITFTTTAGTLSATSAVTDITGKATVTLSALTVTSPTTATITATWRTYAASTTVTLTKETIQLTAAPTIIPINSPTQSKITATVTVSSTPIPGANITFTTDAGTLSSLWAITDTNGVATVNLTAGPTPALANITAKWINTIAYTNVLIAYDAIQVTASPTTIVIQSTMNSTITATATRNSKPYQGANITFTTTAGNLSKSWAITDANGKATVNLTARYWTSQTTATVTATWTTLTGPISDSKTVIFTVETIQMTASPTIIAASSTMKSTIIATVTVNGNPVVGANVTFTTDAGSLSSQWAITNSSGMAQVYLTAGTSPATATVTATWINTSNSAAVQFQTATVQVSASPTVIVIKSTMKSTITAIVTLGGNPVANTNVAFTTNASSLSSSGAVTNSSGAAWVYLNAGTTSTTARVTATWMGISGSATVRLTVENIQVSASPTVIAVNSDMKSTITANVTVNSTPIAGANVTFNTDAGTLSQRWAITDANGIARVNLTAGTTPSIASVTAIWINTQGYTTVQFVLDEVQVSASPTVIAIQSTMNSTITTLVTRDGNPLAGVTVTFATTNGTLSSSEAVTNATGHATVNLPARWCTSPTIATVTATWTGISGPISNSTTVSFETATVEVKASLTVMATNSTLKSTITANVTLGIDPVVGANVTFATTNGSLSSLWAITDMNGIASVNLTAGMSPANATVTATWMSLSGSVEVRFTNLYVTTDKASYTRTSENATISGLLRDENGAPLAGVNVTISIVAANGTTILSVEVTTGSDGEFTYILDLGLIPPDTYTVVVTYQTYEERYHTFEVKE